MLTNSKNISFSINPTAVNSYRQDLVGWRYERHWVHFLFYNVCIAELINSTLVAFVI